MLVFRDNPYTWDISSLGIKSSVIDFSLKTPDGKSLDVSDLQEPVELFIPKKEDAQSMRNNTAKHYFAKPGHGSENMRYHRVVVPSESVLVTVELKAEDGKYMEVYVSHQTRPTVVKHDFATVIPDLSSCSEIRGTKGFNCSSDPFRFDISSAVTGHTGQHFVGIKFLDHESNSSSSLEPRVEIAALRQARSCESLSGRQKRSCIGVKDPPTTPPQTPTSPMVIIPKYNSSTDVNYTMFVTITSCLYWSEKMQAWTDDGCKVENSGCKFIHIFGRPNVH